MNGYKFIATFFGIGYIGKGAGTIAALFVGVLLYYGVQFNIYTSARLFSLCIALMATGTFVSSKVEKVWGKDSKRVVVDEALGMCVSVVFLPISAGLLLSGFLLFRFFDIYKPLFIRKTEKLPGGWGVMTDDLLAGVYTNCILHMYLFATI